MGIQGLLPFLKKIHTPVNVSQFKGCTVAIDAYCWLHKGAFSCADKLALGEKTEQYVYYCMKYVDCLLRNDVKPILVFDGCHLPSKKDVESSRRERRELNRKKAAQLLREGRRAEAKECLQRCVDITSQMALELMNACRARGVDCIVAPYEADAQLAYLNKTGFAQVIITEDSDLLLFGCQKVIFKMDFFGNGVLIEQRRLNEVVEIADGFYTFDKFRYMCILSGCDYLPSLPGIGLAKACKVFKVARQQDIRQLLRKVPSYLKMSLVVTDDYIDGFIRADNTFLYQLTFDPVARRLCPLTPYCPEVDVEELRYAGPYFSDQLALQIALGNVDIHSRERIADFDPNTYVPKYAKKQVGKTQNMVSIWNPVHQPCPPKDDMPEAEGREDVDTQRPCLVGREMTVTNTLTKRSPVKRVREVPDSMDVKTDTELADLYSAPQALKKRRRDADESLHRSPSAPPASFSNSKRPKPSHSSDEDDDTKPRQKEKKQVLSPSKSSNQMTPKHRMTADDALSLIDRDSAVVVSPDEKENGRNNVFAKRNKFAVSALARRARFSLDGPCPLPNVTVHVKSRYFNSSPALPPSSTEDERRKTSEDIPSTPENNQTSSTTSPKENEKRLTSDGSPATSKPHHKDSDQPVSPNILDDVLLSPITPAQNTSLSSKFGYRQEKKTPPEPQARGHLSQGSSSSSQGKRSKTSDKLSPASAFSWSSFKFAKSGSSPALSSLVGQSSSNKPFKRVVSQSQSGSKEQERSSSKCDGWPGDRGDWTKKSVENGSDVRHCRDRTASDQCQSDEGEGDGGFSGVADSQGSIVDLGLGSASQRSNVCSMDSDCFPTSQDFVDLTDADDDGLAGKAGEGGGESGGDWISPASSSQTILKSPRTTPRTTPGVGGKKCRVSGLSRGKKKAPSPRVDDKQQKIRDMFSRFAHRK